MTAIDRRQSTIRRDLNDLVREEGGRLSPTKIGTLVGQWLSVKLILENGEKIIANWDSLSVLFLVLIAPEIAKKMLNMKYGGVTSTTTETTSSNVVKRREAK